MRQTFALITALALSLPALRAAEGFPEFRWDTVPVYAHLANMSEDFTQEQCDFLAEHFDFITIEKGQAVRKGWVYTRDFAHASVFVDLEAKTARIDWNP